MVSLKVDGLSHRTTIDDVEALFDKYGRIGDVYIPKVGIQLHRSILPQTPYLQFHSKPVILDELVGKSSVVDQE